MASTSPNAYPCIAIAPEGYLQTLVADSPDWRLIGGRTPHHHGKLFIRNSSLEQSKEIKTGVIYI
jgi:hypothetical protein